MSKKLLSLCLFILLSLSLSAEMVQHNYNNYQISDSPYHIKNKNYTAYKFFKTKKQLLSDNYDTIYLMIASPSTQSIGSFGGHTLIVLSNKDGLSNATAINFYGEHETLNTFEKAVKGSTKGLPGYIDIRPFSQIAERYTIGQERTLFYYQLDIDKEGINRLIDELYEITSEKGLVYQFFARNCANLSMKLFEAALNKDLAKDTPFMLIPAYLPIIMEKNNLILEEGTFTPPIAKLNKEDLNISKELIKEKVEFYNNNLTETSFNDNSAKFIPQKDLYDYGTKLDSYMSQLSLGINNTNPTLGFAFFASKRYQQSQGPTTALQINFLEMKLRFDEKVKIDNFNFFEFSSYPKINYGFGFTKKFSIMGERDLSDNLQPVIKGGFGISLGNPNILFDLTNDIDIPLSHLGINLSLNSEIILYNKLGYILLEGNLPYYQVNSENKFSLKSKAGITLFDRLDIEGGYNWLNKDFEASIIYNFNPFYFG